MAVYLAMMTTLQFDLPISVSLFTKINKEI